MCVFISLRRPGWRADPRHLQGVSDHGGALCPDEQAGDGKPSGAHAPWLATPRDVGGVCRKARSEHDPVGVTFAFEM